MDDVVIGSDLMTAQGYQLFMGKQQIKRISNGTKTQGKIVVTSANYLTLAPFQSVNLGFKLGGDTRDGELRMERGKYVSEGPCKVENGKGMIVVRNKGFVPIQIRRGQQVCLLNSVRQPLQRISSPREKVGTICGQTKLNASSAKNSTTQRLKSTAKKEEVAWKPEQPICSSEPLWNMSNEKMGINTVRKGSHNHVVGSSKSLTNKIIKSDIEGKGNEIESKFHFLLQSFPDIVIASELVHNEQKPSVCCEKLVRNVISKIPGCSVASGSILTDTPSADVCMATLNKVLKVFRLHGLELNLSAVKAETTSVTFWGYNVSTESRAKATSSKLAVMQRWVKPDSISELRSFVELASFFETTTPSISHMLTPLKDLIQKVDIPVVDRIPNWASELVESLKATVTSNATSGSLCVWCGVTRHDPKNATLDVVQSQVLSAQKSDKWAKALICYVKYDIVPENRYLRKWVLKYGRVARISSNLVGISENKCLKCFAPATIRKQLIQMCHGLSNHRNKVNTINELSSWFWPNLETDVSSFVDNCNSGSRRSNSGRKRVRKWIGVDRQFSRRRTDNFEEFLRLHRFGLGFSIEGNLGTVSPGDPSQR